MTSLSGVAAITFDVDNTLWDFDGVTRGALRKVLDELSLLEPEAARSLDVDRMIAIRNETQDLLRGRVNDLNAVREESMKQALREAGRPDDELGARLTQVYFRHRDASLALFPDARPALERLASSYRIGLLSNGNTGAAALGIGDLVSFEVFPQDHSGIEKPDPRIFEIAVEQAGCPAREIAHVGDSLENDVAGACNAGFQPVWLNRTGAASDARAEVEIRSLEELVALLMEDTLHAA